VLNGSKQFISNGSEAGSRVSSSAVTDKGAGKHGSTLFIVDPAEPGYQVSRVEQKLGQRSAHVAQIQLDDCRVPAGEHRGQRRRRLQDGHGFRWPKGRRRHRGGGGRDGAGRAWMRRCDTPRSAKPTGARSSACRP
jgi:hypothetical protein